MSGSSGLLDRGVRILPAVEPNVFNPAALDLCAIVLKEDESIVLFRHGVGSRTVPETTVSSKMIAGPRGIFVVELS
jgi:hypothetical protein